MSDKLLTDWGGRHDGPSPTLVVAYPRPSWCPCSSIETRSMEMVSHLCWTCVKGVVSSFQRLKVVTPTWRVEMSSHTLNRDGLCLCWVCVCVCEEVVSIDVSQIRCWCDAITHPSPAQMGTGRSWGKIFAPVPVTHHGLPYPCPSLLACLERYVGLQGL